MAPNTIDDERLAATITNPAITVDAVVDGNEVDATAILQGILAEFPLTNATYVCEGSELVVDFTVLGATYPVRMVPA